MMLKLIGSVKSFFIHVIILTVLIISFYYVWKRSVDHYKSPISSLRDLQLNKIDQLLSANEQAALIKEIVKESLKEFVISETSQSKDVTGKLEKNTNQTIDSILLQKQFHKGMKIHGNHSLRNSKLEAFQIQTTLEERSMMYTLLEVFDEVMKRNNVTYFMYGGTLLGSFRHHDLIPWDDDLDVIVSLEHKERMNSALESLKPDFILYHAGGHDKFYHKDAKKASGYNWLWPYLDISFYEKNSTYIKDWIKTYNFWYYYPVDIVFPLHDRPLLNLSLPAPKDTFAFLTWTYNYGSSCFMGGYSHMVEGGGPNGKINCKNLADKFPFVEHLPDNNGVREVLKYKDLEIRNIVIDEPKYAVAETFELSLKSGFTMPLNITPSRLIVV